MRRTFVIWYADHEICGRCLSASNRRIARYRCVVCVCPRYAILRVSEVSFASRGKFVRLDSELFRGVWVYIVHTKVRHVIGTITFWRFGAYLTEITPTPFVVAVYPSTLWSAVSCIEILAYRNASSSVSVRDGKVNSRYLNLLCSTVTSVFTWLPIACISQHNYIKLDIILLRRNVKGQF